MDRSTFSTWGSLICVVLVVAIMMAFATPFGKFVTQSTQSVLSDFKATADEALNASDVSLEDKYQFAYYNTLNQAITDVNNSTTEGADSNKEAATAGVYTNENGDVVVVLKRDTTESDVVNITKDMTLYLGGNTLNFSPNANLYINNASVTIDGTVSGSAIKKKSTEANVGKVERLVNVAGGELFVNGGTYISDVYSVKGNLAFTLGSSAVCEINNCIIESYTNEGSARSVQVAQKAALRMNNCDLLAVMQSSNDNDHAYTLIVDDSTAILENCNIYADTPSGNGAALVGVGIYNQKGGTLTAISCNVFGTFSGAYTKDASKMYIKGGMYTSSTHGGLYFSNENGENYVQDATIANVEYNGQFKDIYDYDTLYHAGGMYIGGNSNISVHMDNCTISNDWGNPIALRGTSGEQNLYLYISNSTVNGAYSIRVDNDTMRVYVGEGTNITLDMVSKPEVVEFTGERYVKQ